MRREVYRHLRRKVWSLRNPKTGLVVRHAAHVEILDAEFRVQKAARAAQLRTGVRRVHAYAVGELVAARAHRPARHGKWLRAFYDPWTWGTFMLARTRPVPIFGAGRVRLDRDGVWVQGPRFTTTTKPRKRAR